MPDTIQFCNGNQIVNSYDAGGRKLSTLNYTLLYTLPVPLTEGEVLQLYYDMDIVDETGTFYVDNIEYSSEARWYYPAIMRKTTIDPMSEGYFNTSVGFENPNILYKAGDKYEAYFGNGQGIINSLSVDRVSQFEMWLDSEARNGLELMLQILLEM